MPWLANTILPLIFDDPKTINEVAGAWIGGTVDTTSGVGASSAIVSDDANKVAMVVKGVQNILIGVVAFFIALYLSARSESGKMQRPSLGIVWEKFPKFVLGFVIASALFSVLSANDMLKKGELKEPKAQEVVADVKVSPEEEASMNVIAAAELNSEQPVIVADAAVNNEELKAAPKAEKKPERKKNSSKDIAKMFSGLFFSLAFVCIGLDTRLKDIISKENRALLKSFLIAQTFNIIVTFVLACLFFGVLKQM
jgi:uncharacterized membrane protein YadS